MRELVGDSFVVGDLCQFPGRELMAYLLNVEPPTLDGSENPGWRTASLVSQVWTYLYAERLADRNPQVVANMRLGALSVVTDDHQTSWLNAAHIESGGTISETILVPDDPVAAALSRCLRDVWPYYLSLNCAGPLNLFFAASCPGLMQHPAFDVAMQEFIKDPDLCRIFPYPPSAVASDIVAPEVFFRYYSFIHSSESSTDSVLPFLLGNCVLTAVVRLFLRGVATVSYPNVVDELRAVLRELRLLAAGERVAVPTLTGFAGFRLEENCVVELGERGSLRPVSDQDRRLFLTDAPGVATVLESTELVAIHSATVRDVSAGEGFDGPDASSNEAVAADRREASREVDKLRLAILLSSHPGIPRLMRETGRYVSDIVAPGGAVNAEFGTPGLTSPLLGSAETANIIEWQELISSGHCLQMETSMRRLLSAASSRASTSDAFVDAVVCWESLFGARADTSFRVAGAIAKLVEPRDGERRLSLYRELKTMYGVRSTVVHGGKEPLSPKLSQYRSRSVEIAIESMRRLYRDRTDLLDMESEPRSTQILLE